MLSSGFPVRLTAGLVALAAGAAAPAQSIEKCIEKGSSSSSGFYEESPSAPSGPKLGTYWPSWQKCVKNWVKYDTAVAGDAEAAKQAAENDADFDSIRGRADYPA